MGYGAILGVLGGVLGGAGSAAGGILPSILEKDPPLILSGGFSPSTDPLLAAASFQSLLPYGIVDPTVLQRSSPVQRAIADFQRSAQGRGVRQKAIRQINQIIANVQSGMPIHEAILRGTLSPGKADKKLRKLDQDYPEAQAKLDAAVRDAALSKPIQQFLSFTGYGTLSDLISAEQDYQQQIAPLTSGLGDLSSDLYQAQLGAMQQRADLIGNLPDASAAGIAELRDAERDRLLAGLDEIQKDALRQANISGINPGRQLAELDEFRATDLELEALNRAIGLLSGQQSLAAQGLGILDSAIGVPNQTAAGLASLRVGNPGVGGIVGGVSNAGALAAGQGVSQGLNTLGGTLASIPQIQQNNQLYDLLIQSLGKDIPANPG